MKTAIARLKSVSPYSQSAYIVEKKPRDETHEQFEERTWKQKAHVGEDGIVFIPPMAFKNCLDEAAKYKSIQIPGKGKSTYTKHFEAGVLVVEPIPIGVHVDDMQSEVNLLDSNGVRGSGTRVLRKFPVFPKWEADVPFLVFDEMIHEDIFEQHLIDAGQFIGIGRFRPRKRGYYGRFRVESIKWSKQ